MGSVEDEMGDGAARYAKLRPMRVEMFLRVPTKDLRSFQTFYTRKSIAADSGETTRFKMILAVQIINVTML